MTDNWPFRHPVYQEYLPSMLTGEKILLEEGDLTGKEWDEAALRQWEWRNQIEWPGRKGNRTTEGPKNG